MSWISKERTEGYLSALTVKDALNAFMHVYGTDVEGSLIKMAPEAVEPIGREGVYKVTIERLEEEEDQAGRALMIGTQLNTLFDSLESRTRPGSDQVVAIDALTEMYESKVPAMLGRIMLLAEVLGVDYDDVIKEAKRHARR